MSEPSDQKTGTNGAIARIEIMPSDRVFIVGTTGSGKSTLAQRLLARRKYLVVLDPKHQFSLDNTPKKTSKVNSKSDNADVLITSDLKECYKWESPKPIIYRPSLMECDAGLPQFWSWIWGRGNTLVYVDEVLRITPPVNIPRGFATCIQMGRSRDIGIWCATQRPARIPIPILSESEHDFIFRLRHPADLKRMADYTDPEIIRNPVANHDFWYYNDREQLLFKGNSENLRISRKGKTK